MTDDTGKLRVIAPAVAEWPSWWRRNLTPGALYTISAVVLASVVTITTFVVSHHRDSEQLDKIETTLNTIQQAVSAMQPQVASLTAWKEKRQELAEELANPYVKSHDKLQPKKAKAQ